MNLDRSVRWSRVIAIVGLSALFLLPLIFMVGGSLRQPGLPPPDGFEWWPDDPRWGNYRSAFGFVDLWTHVRNSGLVVAVAVPVTVLVASWAGFAIATATAAVRRRLVVLSLVALMVPLSALWVPRFVMFKWMGLLEGLTPLIAPSLMATTPFYVLIFALAYSRIPKQLFEAARVEGLRPFQIWRRIAFPLAKPAAFAVGVLAFTFHWSNFVDALLYVSS
ncbi:MAG: carbohydrate ABC transporter permease, partial [Actinomycetota bacterium]